MVAEWLAILPLIILDHSVLPSPISQPLLAKTFLLDLVTDGVPS